MVDGESFIVMLGVHEGLDLPTYGDIWSRIAYSTGRQSPRDGDLTYSANRVGNRKLGAFTCHDRDRPNIAERDCGRDWLSMLPIGPILEGTGAARDDDGDDHEHMRVANAPWAASDDGDQRTCMPSKEQFNYIIVIIDSTYRIANYEHRESSRR